MNLTSEKASNNSSITIIRCAGDLDAASYLSLIDFAKKQVEAGAQNLLLDLTELRFMASSGLVAMYSLLMLLRGGTPPNPEEGWNAIHAVSREVEQAAGFDPHLKVLNPQPRVAKTLAMTGFDKIVQAFTDEGVALSAFS